MLDIELLCPYCGNKFQVNLPKDYEKLPQEIACMPYTRDIGRFDPKPDDDIFSAVLWSRIGKDYLNFINYEKIGILRITQPGVNVQYRVQQCPGCNNLFDVFANYTDDQTFETLWPHLFRKDASGEVSKLYKGENSIIKLIRKLKSITHSNIVSVLLLAVIVFCLGWLPFLLISKSDLSQFSCDLPSLISNTTCSYFLYKVSIVRLIPVDNIDSIRIISAVLFGSIAIGVAVLSLIFVNYLSFLRTSKDFNELFQVSDPGNGVIFWKNYTSARFVGVQDEKTRFPRLTQSDVFAGGTSIVLAIISWFLNQYNNFISAFAKGYFNVVVFDLVELFAWILVIYFLATAIFLSMSLTFYVLNGVRKIPMNISPFDNFSTSRPLTILESYSINIILIVSVLILIILSALQFLIPIPWIIVWLEWAVALLFVILGFGLGQAEYLVGAILYFLLFLLAPGYIPASPVDGKIIVLGAFFTFMVAFHLRSSSQFVESLLSGVKEKIIKMQKKQLSLLNSDLQSINEKISSEHRINVLSELYAQRYSVLSSIQKVVDIINFVEKVSVSKNLIRQIPEILTPLISSLVLPVSINLVTPYLMRILNIKSS